MGSQICHRLDHFWFSIAGDNFLQKPGPTGAPFSKSEKMLEDQVAYLLQRYLGNYVRGLNKEALKISVWKGDVELTNMQLKPEALNALKLPIKVKAGFLGSVKLKVPWSRLGQDPVLVYLDRIFLLAEPATHVEGGNEDGVQEVKRSRIRDMEIKLLEKTQYLNAEVNQSWLGSLINTIIGNLKLSISNIHIRYEDHESNPGHPFAAGLTLEKLSAFTVDDSGKETFATGGALDQIQKSVELEALALYFDSDISPWNIDKTWEDLLPSEWSQVFKFGTKGGKPAPNNLEEMHTYILQPVTGNAKYIKLLHKESGNGGQPSQKAAVHLDDVTICLSKDGYRDLMKLADNFAAFNQRLKYAHYRPSISVSSDPRSWWRYACKAVTDDMKKASGRLSWEHVLKYAKLRKKYISLYASLLKAEPGRAVIDDNREIGDLDRELDIELVVQWRMVAHKYVQRSLQLDSKKQQPKSSWWSFGSNQSSKDDVEALNFSNADWEQLNKIIGYKEGDEEQFIESKKDVLHACFDIYMRHNASKLMDGHKCLAELSCKGLSCSIRLYPEAKVFDLKLGSYYLSSPNGLLAVSATAQDSLVGTFWYKPFDMEMDWSLVAKASPCYMTYLKDSFDQIIKFFDNNAVVSQAIALETAAAVQMTIDGVKRTAQQQMNRALKDHARFFLDLDIAAPKITIPTDFCPDNIHPAKLMLDLGNLVIRTEDSDNSTSSKDDLLYLKFDLVLSDVSAFLIDGDYHWGKSRLTGSSNFNGINFLPVIDRCGVVVKFQQIRLENPLYPSTRLAVWIPSLAFHFSPARYHRLMQIAKIFSEEDNRNIEPLRPWSRADFEGWLSLLTWKGVANREPVWQRRYMCLVGPFLYVLESADSKSYKQYISLRGKHVYKVPAESIGNEDNVLALCDPGRSNNNVVEDANALVLLCDSVDSTKVWQSRLQGAVYRASASAPITALSETSSDPDESDTEVPVRDAESDITKIEKIFIAGVLDEFKICFNYAPQHENKFMKVLLSEEKHLFEFRAIGGRVEISMKGTDMFIGTVLKSLEIEDLVCGSLSRRCYLARSFIGGPDKPQVVVGNKIQSYDSSDLAGDGDDKFYEAPEDLVEADGSSQNNFSDCVSTPSSMPAGLSLSKAPSFSRVSHLLPDDAIESTSETVGNMDYLDSFIKAQIVIYNQSSPLYNKIDKKVAVTLATLSFFCRRPTVIAIMDFGNSITIEDENCESYSDNSSTALTRLDSREDLAENELPAAVVDPVVKGLLGTGKSRVIFCLTLNMSRTQIILLKEDESKLATLSQHNLLTEIKVFPSSFSIDAALGNLRISDDSLPEEHMYFWACDMRNPGGSSFVELAFCSYSIYDDDYKGYDFSLHGQLSEVRIVYLNRFIQEVVSYFVGLSPETSKGVVKLRDQVTNSEKWFTKSEIEGSPALKLELSLTKPIILMPRRTDSPDYLKLDVVHITIQNTFQWYGGNKDEISAVHLELLTVLVEDINLNVGTGTELGDSIIHEVKGVSVVIQRSLRDLLHQVPSVEAKIGVNVLKAALSNREYEIISECAQSNISETANVVPHMTQLPSHVVEPTVEPETSIIDTEDQNAKTWINFKVIVAIELVELSLHSGVARDASLATVQVSNAWILFKSNTVGGSFLSGTLKSFNVFDDREGIEEQFRLAIGKPKGVTYSSLLTDEENQQIVEIDVPSDSDMNLGPTMLIFDIKLSQESTSVSLCIQRPQLLVALDFLLAVVEFFVPSVHGLMSKEEDEASSYLMDAIILDRSTFVQPSPEFSLSPNCPLVLDDERYNHFIYDGNGGTLVLRDRRGTNLCTPSLEPIIYIGSGKSLQFKNVVIKDGRFLDSCIILGTESSYSAAEDDKVLLEAVNPACSTNSSGENAETSQSQNVQADKSMEYVIELQAIGPELTFYNKSKDVGSSLILSNKLLHAQLDAFSRIVLKGDTLEMSANALGFTMESNGIRILEPFDTSIEFTRVSGKTNIHISVSDIFLNFSFSILRLFLAVEEDMLGFIRTTSKKMTMSCSEFDKLGKIESRDGEQVYAFWRPRAPPGFAILGDYLTPIDKPPTKGVLAVNMNLVRVKRPVSFRLVWPVIPGGISVSEAATQSKHDAGCSVWFPVAPNGYVAMGCVVSPGFSQPLLSSAYCILASLVSPCPLRDLIQISRKEDPTSLAFWRVDNSLGTFLPAVLASTNSVSGAYELRHLYFRASEDSVEATNYNSAPSPSTVHPRTHAEITNSGQHFEPVASFQLVWWNQNSSSRKKLSIWRPVVPQGMIYFGDIAVRGYEPPNTCIVLEDLGEEFYKMPLDFLSVGQIKKQRGMEPITFWLPQPPPGFVALGCVACKGSPKNSEFISLRCIRSDMVAGDQFSDESIWDSSDARVKGSPFSIWTVGNELGTFLIRNGYRRPPKRYALKLADRRTAGGSDDTVIDAEISTFSVALFDDFGGLMVPLCNLSLSSIGFSLHGRPDYLNATVGFSLAARSYNDKNECWEPLVEPVDGFLRYQYDISSPGAASQLRLTSTRDLNINISVSNANTILQAYASWNNLTQVHQSCIEREATSPDDSASSIIDIHHRRNYFIIPQNKLGQDIFIRAAEIKGLPRIMRMPTGDTKALRVPVSKNMLDSHLRGDTGQNIRTMVTILIAEAEFQGLEGLSSRQYAVAVRLNPEPSLLDETVPSQQSARTCGSSSVVSSPPGLESVKWSEAFFFKVDSLENYSVELLLTDMGKGDLVGFYSAPLNQVAIQERPSSHGVLEKFNWIELCSPATIGLPGDAISKYIGRLRCAILFSTRFEVEDNKESRSVARKPGFIQISPTREGPWTPVRLNYAAPAACWRLGNSVVASEVKIKDGNRYVNIRSLVSVRNSTDFTLDVYLKLRSVSGYKRPSDDVSTSEKYVVNGENIETDEFFEVEKYNAETGWNLWGNSSTSESLGGLSKQPIEEISEVRLPPGWEWVDDWHVDKVSVKTSDGWVYAPDYEHLKWPESYDPKDSKSCVRKRKWIRKKKRVLDALKDIFIGVLKPGDTIPLPLSGLTANGAYSLHLRPIDIGIPDEYSWSSVIENPARPEDSRQCGNGDICVSTLEESDNLLYCAQASGASSSSSRGIWFCLRIQGSDIAKDIHGDPIQDWSLVVKSPLSIANYLPLKSEYSILEMQENGHYTARSRGIFSTGKTVNIYSADITKSLLLSLLPQKGWLPSHEAVVISTPHGAPVKALSLKSSVSRRTVKVILEQNHDKERPLMPKAVRVYAPFWFSIARCPTLKFKIISMDGKKQSRKILPFKSRQNDEEILEEITGEELYEGHTMASTLNFKLLGLSVSISNSGEDIFGPVQDLSPLGDMDGSVELSAYGSDGNCMQLFVSSKPCPFQSVPTKVISIRPFMTFTNRVGEDVFIKLSADDAPKTLHASDSRMAFVYRETTEPKKLQVRLAETKWSYPVEITKEDSFCLVLRDDNGNRRFLKAEVRGYEEGSRFIVVFRLGSARGPVRFENRTARKKISIRQSGFDDEYWINLAPLSTTRFSWEDPYGSRLVDVKVCRENSTSLTEINLEATNQCSLEGEVQVLMVHDSDVKVARFTDVYSPELPSGVEGVLAMPSGNLGVHQMHRKAQSTTSPLELIIEFGVVGVSIIDHRPRELTYLYMDRVFISYSSGYDGGTTSRFKLIMGNLQLDNQLPLALMPVLLAPEQATDLQHPVFKMTLTIRNENTDGIQVYPYIYIRVTEKCWRLNIHEPIIWAAVDFYNNLQLDRLSGSSNVTTVDPEIRIDLIDVSEVRLKISFETAPAQRPQGVLGVWSPILSAIGNAFKIQVHLRKVMHKGRFMRKSSVVSAITNRIWRDLIHNPLHLLFSVDVLGMTSSTLASMSKGFAELSTDGQFLQLRSKQVWSRRVTGVGDGLIQGTEAFAQGVAFGVSGVVRKPVESARQNGVLGLADGLGRAFVGFIVQPVSGALDFLSLTVDGIGASCARCFEVLNNRTLLQRIRNPRAIHSDGVLREYSEREAAGQMILHLAEASHHFGCTEIFKEPSKFALSDYYEEHFMLPQKRIALVTSKRIMLLQRLGPYKIDRKPCKIMWDVAWDELLAIELAKAGHPQPCHLILHLKTFKRSEVFARVIKCNTEEDSDSGELQAVKMCSMVRKMWKGYQSKMKSLILKVPSSQRQVHFSWSEAETRGPHRQNRSVIMSRELSSCSTQSDDSKFVEHGVNFTKIWSSEFEPKGRCTICQKKVLTGEICTIWRPTCPPGYVSIGDVARIGTHPPNVAAVYRYNEQQFANPIGFDLVWRNCADDYKTPGSIWLPRAPEGYTALGCVAVASFAEPDPGVVYCVAESLADDTGFEEQEIWFAPDSYPWGCHIYQVQSDALHFMALRQPREELQWKPKRVLELPSSSE
ncbi:hypothetical protein V2J09_014844 [Rumex salicifolius]